MYEFELISNNSQSDNPNLEFSSIIKVLKHFKKLESDSAIENFIFIAIYAKQDVSKSQLKKLSAELIKECPAALNSNDSISQYVRSSTHCIRPEKPKILVGFLAISKINDFYLSILLSCIWGLIRLFNAPGSADDYLNDIQITDAKGDILEKSDFKQLIEQEFLQHIEKNHSAPVKNRYLPLMNACNNDRTIFVFEQLIINIWGSMEDNKFNTEIDNLCELIDNYILNNTSNACIEMLTRIIGVCITDQRLQPEVKDKLTELFFRLSIHTIELPEVQILFNRLLASYVSSQPVSLEQAHIPEAKVTENIPKSIIDMIQVIRQQNEKLAANAEELSRYKNQCARLIAANNQFRQDPDNKTLALSASKIQKAFRQYKSAKNDKSEKLDQQITDLTQNLLSNSSIEEKGSILEALKALQGGYDSIAFSKLTF